MVEPVVLLVDNKTRDLDVSALIAHQLKRRGVPCYLEPLEAFRAALVHRPGMIVFNHLFASHLAAWSNRLNELGVLTAVLTNEGMVSDASMKFQSGVYHSSGHVDYFFCWNDRHGRIVRDGGAYPEAKVHVVGVPRFDFYAEPWSKVICVQAKGSSRPRVLVCTNTGLAPFWERPREQADQHFAAWKNHIPGFGDHWPKIEAHWRARSKFLNFVTALTRRQKFDVVLRPHPAEPPNFYKEWAATLPAAERPIIESNGNISGLILGSDIVISEDGCTTGLESWIAGKTTVGLNFGDDYPHHKPERARGHVQCTDVEKIVDIVEAELVGSQERLRQTREEILREWCGFIDGRATERISDVISEAIKNKHPSDWSKLNFSDYRRGLKLRVMNAIGEAYHFNPLISRDSPKARAYRKSIRPRDVRDALSRFDIIK